MLSEVLHQESWIGDIDTDTTVFFTEIGRKQKTLCQYKSPFSPDVD